MKINKKTIEEKLEKVVQSIINPDSNKDILLNMEKWDWHQGVALFALYLYSKEKNDSRTKKYLFDWFDFQIKKGLPQKNINTVCPLLTLSYLYEETKNPNYFSILEEWLAFLLNELPKTEENGFQHLCIDNPNNIQLWADTMYMSVLFVAKMGSLTNNKNCIEESIRQYLVHIKYLTDNSTGLMYHAWNFEGRHNFGKILWARGNSWYTAGLVEYLGMVDINKGTYNYLITTLQQQVIALEKYQDNSGLWKTVINDESSYTETSSSSAFTYGILKAIRLNLIPEKYIECATKAIKGIINQIDDDGIVKGVSAGTCVGWNSEYYKKIPVKPMPYGQSMAILALVEALNHF